MTEPPNKIVIIGGLVIMAGIVLFSSFALWSTTQPKFQKRDKETSLVVNCISEGVICK